MNKWKEILATLIIFFSFYVLVKLTSSETHQNSQFETEIPLSTKVHFLINGRFLLKELLITELFESKDENVILKIKDLMSQKGTGKSNLTNLSIDYSQPVEFLQITLNSNDLFALKFKIVNTAIFDLNKNRRNSIVFLRKKNNGILIFSDNNLKLKQLKNIFTRNCFRFHLKTNNQTQYVSFFKNSKLTSTNEINIQKNTVQIHSKSTYEKANNLILKPKGFHLSSKIEVTNSKLLQGIPFLGIIKPEKINFISINYLGLKIKDNGMIPAIPKLEMLLTYSIPLSSDNIINKLIKDSKIEIVKSKKNTYIIDNESITVKQITPKSFFISTISSDFSAEYLTSDLFICGDPNKVIKIENAGWKSLFLEMIPAYKSTQNFLKQSEKATTIIKNRHEQDIVFHFKKDEKAIHALLKYILSFQ